jgi:hypothetical protein
MIADYKIIFSRAIFKNIFKWTGQLLESFHLYLANHLLIEGSCHPWIDDFIVFPVLIISIFLVR